MSALAVQTCVARPRTRSLHLTVGTPEKATGLRLDHEQAARFYRASRAGNGELTLFCG